MSWKVYRLPLLLFAACLVVGVLAALGRFSSMIGFPLVFAAICAAIGLVSLWWDPGPLVPRAALVLLGPALAVGGWHYQMEGIRASLERTQGEVWALLGGKPAPRLLALEPLATDPDELAAAADFRHRATIVTFWATWCSPCWAEMAELQELFEEHRGDGLTVLALTAYDHSETEEGRKRDRANAEKFLRKRGLEYPAAITAEGDNYRAWEVRSIPSTALVDAAGTLVAYAVGLDGARELMAQAEAMLAP